ncbi:MAG: ComF family protein [Pseudoramibacter sp.]
MSGPLLETISRLLFIDNDRCPVCGKILFGKSDYLCASCLRNLPVNGGPVCRRCGRPVLTHEETLCKTCRKEENHSFDRGYVWLIYDSRSEKIAAGFKFKYQKTLAFWAGQQMAEGFAKTEWAHQIDALVPVPLHPNRLAERGYNQSEQLAAGLASALKEKGIAIAVDSVSLRRAVDTPHQVGQSAAFRRENVKQAFRAVSSENIQDRRIALVDDVMTTGATLDSCAAALREAGAKSVSVITFAATMG